MFVLFSVNHAGPRPSIPARNLPAHEIRANLADLDALGHCNRARARRETAFRAAKIVQQRAEPVPRSSDVVALQVEIALRNRDSRPVRRPSTRPVPTSSTREPIFFALFCGFCQKLPKSNLERIFSKKSRIGGFLPVLPIFFCDFRQIGPGMGPDWPEDRGPGAGVRAPRIGRRGPRSIGSADPAGRSRPARRGARPGRPASKSKGHVSDK